MRARVCCMCVCHILFIHSPLTDTGSFHVLAPVNNAAVNSGCRHLFQMVFSVPSDTPPEAGPMDLRAGIGRVPAQPALGSPAKRVLTSAPFHRGRGPSSSCWGLGGGSRPQRVNRPRSILPHLCASPGAGTLGTARVCSRADGDSGPWGGEQEKLLRGQSSAHTFSTVLVCKLGTVGAAG